MIVFQRKFGSNQTAHNYSTIFASNRNLVHPLVHSSKMFKSFFSNAFKLCNDLPVLIKNERTLGRLKSFLRHKLFVTSLGMSWKELLIIFICSKLLWSIYVFLFCVEISCQMWLLILGAMIKKTVEILVFHVTFFGVIIDFTLLVYSEWFINYVTILWL